MWLNTLEKLKIFLHWCTGVIQDPVMSLLEVVTGVKGHNFNYNIPHPKVLLAAITGGSDWNFEAGSDLNTAFHPGVKLLFNPSRNHYNSLSLRCALQV